MCSRPLHGSVLSANFDLRPFGAVDVDVAFIHESFFTSLLGLTGFFSLPLRVFKGYETAGKRVRQTMSVVHHWFCSLPMPPVWMWITRMFWLGHMSLFFGVDILLSLLGPVHLTDGLVVNCAEGFYSVQTTPGLSSSCLLTSCIEHGSVDPVAEVYF